MGSVLKRTSRWFRAQTKTSSARGVPRLLEIQCPTHFFHLNSETPRQAPGANFQPGQRTDGPMSDTKISRYF